MDGEDLKWLDCLVQENYNISQVICSDLIPAVEPGDNYISMVYRVALQAITNNGNNKQLSLIVKKKVVMDIEENLQEKIAFAFKLEYRIYREILPTVGKYMPHDEPQLWPLCLGMKSDNEIYFEDLKETGYSMAVRQEGLDDDQTQQVFRRLAHLHASSYLAYEKGELDMTDYKQYIMLGTANLDHRPVTNEFELMTDVILKDWGIEWESVAKRLNKYKDGINDLVWDIGIFEENRLNVFNHGDTWINNLLFKCNASGKADGIKFVDFQISHFNSFGFDLCYFLNTSVGYELKKKHLNSWIKTYCESFSKVLQEHGSSLPPPTPELVRSELVRLSPFSLLTSIRIRPVIMAPREDRVTIPELLQNIGVDPKRRRVYSNPNYINIMKSDLPRILDDMDSLYKQ